MGLHAGRARIIVFTRYPRPGETKTRLIPALGAPGAARLHRRLAEHAVACARKAARICACDVEICCDGSDHSTVTRWLGGGLLFTPQGHGDLGERMRHAVAQALADGAGRVVLIGTDVPGLSAGVLTRALRLLRTQDLILGPSKDGGYYLVGLRRMAWELFAGIPWGTEGVLHATLAKARELALETALVDTLGDVDRPEDLVHLEAIRP